MKREIRKFLIKITINNYDKQNKVKTIHLKEQKEIEIEWNGKFGKPVKANANGDLTIQLKGARVYDIILSPLQVKKGFFKDRIEGHGFKLPPNSDFTIESVTIESTEWKNEGKILIGVATGVLFLIIGLFLYFFRRKKVK